MQMPLMFFSFLASLVMIVPEINAACYQCSSDDFNGEVGFEGDCFKVKNSTATTHCEGNSTYCRTNFVFEDELITRVSRDCVSGTTDNDISTSHMPKANKCTADFKKPGVEQIKCFYHCNQDKCNKHSYTTLKTCQSDCGRPKGHGYCDYIVGKCECVEGWSGSKCTEPPNEDVQHCIQCSTETSKSCKNEKTGAACPGRQRFCSSTQTTIFLDKENKRTVLTRACTDKFLAEDECEFTDIYQDEGIKEPGYSEYTCYSTCELNNCNTYDPNGVVIPEEKRTLACVQCNSKLKDCQTKATACKFGTTHCEATVHYAIADKVETDKEISNGSYKLLSVTRRCAPEPNRTVSECSSSRIGDLTFKIFECKETCQGDGCNVDWPTRPRCVQCADHETCSLTSKKCSGPHEQYCVTLGASFSEGSHRNFSEKKCSYFDLGNECKTYYHNNKTPFQLCNETCNSNNCNTGAKSFPGISHAWLLLIFITFGRNHA